MVEVRLTLRADSDLQLRRTHGLAALNRTLVIRLCGDVVDMGPALTHRDRIVKLFLQGFSESDVAQRTQHTLGCVEQYLCDFLRISLLRQDRYSPGETARLMRLSKGKVQGHLRLLAELEDDPFCQGALRRVLEIYRLRRVGCDPSAHCKPEAEVSRRSFRRRDASSRKTNSRKCLPRCPTITTSAFGSKAINPTV